MEDKKHAKGKTIRTGRPWFLAGIITTILLVSGGIALGFLAARKPDPLVVEQSFRSYVQSLAKAGKIVLVEAREQLIITSTTPRLLFGDNAVGRFLGIRADATIEATAWADLSYCIDLLHAESWSVRYDPADGGTMWFAAPSLSMLTPAVHTDTIEIRTTERSILLDERRLEEAALRGLTARFVEVASARLQDPELRAMAVEALKDIIHLFGAKGGVPVDRIDIDFAPPQS